MRSPLDEKMNDVLAEGEGLSVKVDVVLITKIYKGLGPSIYYADASLVSS